MGFRSTLTTSDYYIVWPKWFRDKYADVLHIPEEGALAARREFKAYTDDLEKDVQRVLRQKRDWPDDMEFVLLWLHECGGVTRVLIYKDRIVFDEPTGWEETDGITHSYCNCSSSDQRERDRQNKQDMIAKARARKTAKLEFSLPIPIEVYRKFVRTTSKLGYRTSERWKFIEQIEAMLNDGTIDASLLRNDSIGFQRDL